MSEKNYVQILEESLEKRIDVLRQLQVLCQEQADILQDDASTPEAFEENIDQKGHLIAHLERLDQGFEQLFAKVEQTLEADRDQYADAIRHMQEMIREITQRSSNLQVLEKQNSELAKAKFSQIRTQTKEIRQSRKVVNSYYQNILIFVKYHSIQFTYLFCGLDKFFLLRGKL